MFAAIRCGHIWNLILAESNSLFKWNWYKNSNENSNEIPIRIKS